MMQYTRTASHRSIIEMCVCARTRVYMYAHAHLCVKVAIDHMGKLRLLRFAFPFLLQKCFLDFLRYNLEKSVVK